MSGLRVYNPLCVLGDRIYIVDTFLFDEGIYVESVELENKKKLIKEGML